MIRKAIHDLMPTPMVHSVIGKVISVSADTVDVDPVNGDARIFNVRLQASEKKASVLLKPKKGSYVIVTFLNQNQAFVSSVSEVDSFALKVGQNDLSEQIGALMDALDGILDIINNLKVLTPAGPSTNLMPDSITSVIKSKADLKALKTRLTSIIKPL